MPGSFLTAFPLIAERSEATPGLWNRVFSTLSDNIGEINSSLTFASVSTDTFSLQTNLLVSGNVVARGGMGIGPNPSTSTRAKLTITTEDSAVTSAIYITDQSGARDNWLIGQGTGNGINALALYNTSQTTSVVHFSSDSVRFFVPVVGRVFDTGVNVLYALAFLGTGASAVSRIQAAINSAAASGISRVLVHDSLLPYSASSISFIYTVQMVREGGDWSVYDVKAYGAAGDNTQDDTAAVISAISAVNSTGSRGRVYFPEGTYSVEGIVPRANVWIDFGSATIKKRSNGTTPFSNSLIRAIETQVSGSYYSTYSNIKITGGFLDANGKTASANLVRLLYTDDLIIDNVTVVNSPSAQWAFTLGGRNGRIVNCKTQGGASVGEDGIHVVHGSNFVVANNDIESGDDAIAIGIENTDAFLAVECDSLRYITVVNNTVKSNNGHAISIYAKGSGTSFEVSDVVVSNIVGTSGVTRNGGIFIQDFNLPAAETTQLKRINISNVALSVGSTNHTDVNAYGIYLQSVGDVTLSDVVMQITEKTGAAAGFDLCIVRNSTDIRLHNLRCDLLQKRFGIDVRDSNRVTIDGCHLRQGTGVLNPIYLDDVQNCKILNNTILDIPAIGGIEITTGTVTNALIQGNTVKQSAITLAGKGVNVLSSAFSHVGIIGNDFSACSSGVNLSSLVAGISYVVSGNTGLLDMMQNGTATAPGVAFASELSLGLFRSAASQIAMSYGQFLWAPGTALRPGSGFTSESSLGFYRSAASTIQQSYGTFVAPNIQANAGSATAPSLTFTSNDSTGLFQIAGSGGGFVGIVGGTNAAAAAYIGGLGVIQLAQNGSAILPSLVFNSEASLGWFKSAVSTMALSYGTLNLNQARLVSIQSLSASATSLLVKPEQLTFFVGGASGCSLYVRSGSNNTIWIFNSDLSSAATIP